LNCEEEEDPSSEPVLPLEPEYDEPDDEEEEEEVEDGVVVTDVELFATLCAPTAIPPASASVAPTLSAPAARRLRRAGCERRFRGLMGLVMATRFPDPSDRPIGATQETAKRSFRPDGRHLCLVAGEDLGPGRGRGRKRDARTRSLTSFSAL
jgi:hypothetical protein